MPGQTKPTISDRARQLRQAFDMLWPVILAIAGLGLIIVIVAIPALRQPALIAALSGMFTVVSTIGLASRGSMNGKVKSDD